MLVDDKHRVMFFEGDARRVADVGALERALADLGPALPQDVHGPAISWWYVPETEGFVLRTRFPAHLCTLCPLAGDGSRSTLTPRDFVLHAQQWLVLHSACAHQGGYVLLDRVPPRAVWMDNHHAVVDWGSLAVVPTAAARAAAAAATHSFSTPAATWSGPDVERKIRDRD